MTKQIPDTAPSLAVGEFTIREIVNGDEYEKIIQTQNRHFGDRGSRIPGLFPTAEEPYFSTTSTSFTQVNGTTTHVEEYGLDRWNPSLKLARKLRDGSAKELKITWKAVIENLELRLFILKGDDITTAVGLNDLTSSSLAEVTATVTLTEAEAAIGDVAGDPERLLVCVAEARIFNGSSGSGTGYLYAGPHGHETTLRSGDEASLPRGY